VQIDSVPPGGSAASSQAAARDTSTEEQRYFQTSRLAEAEHDRAHSKVRAMNARAYAETLRRFRAKHCPPPDAFAAVPRHGAPARRAKPSSVRGKIVACGDPPGTRFALLRANGRALALVGDTTVVARMLGLEVTASGALTGGGRQAWPQLAVERATAHGQEGRQAWDGVLRREAGRDYLELTSGGRRLAIPVLPANLEGAHGLRVWVVGPLAAPGGGGVVGSPARPR
jgi:hypothetical protein